MTLTVFTPSGRKKPGVGPRGIYTPSLCPSQQNSHPCLGKMICRGVLRTNAGLKPQCRTQEPLFPAPSPTTKIHSFSTSRDKTQESYQLLLLQPINPLSHPTSLSELEKESRSPASSYLLDTHNPPRPEDRTPAAQCSTATLYNPVDPTPLPNWKENPGVHLGYQNPSPRHLPIRFCVSMIMQVFSPMLQFIICPVQVSS